MGIISDWGNLRPKVFRFLRRYGIPYDPRNSKDWYNGKKISAGPNQCIDNVLHDAAHWVLAGKRRAIVNFGCGPDPAGNTPEEIPSPETVKDSVGEEILASVLGVAFLVQVGGTGEMAEKVLDYHSWGPTDDIEDDIEAASEIAAKYGIKIPKRVKAIVVGALPRSV